MTSRVKLLWTEQNGQDLTEYALLVVLLGVTAVTALNGLAGVVKSVFTNAASNLSTTAT